MASRTIYARIVSATLACLFTFAATHADAADLPCVRSMITWRDANPTGAVSFHLVALHANGFAAYASGELSTGSCSRAPYAAGQVSCLRSSGTFDALLSDSFEKPNPSAVFDTRKPLAMAFDVIPSDNLAQVHLHQANATYDFDPKCTGDLLTGNDQWGNHWTIAFFTRANFVH
jgi:hypothetical protein